jgi:ABC-type dipeptide/oligopeptide/nickel transport system ATPase subunit
MSPETRMEYFDSMYIRYKRTSHKQKSRILNKEKGLHQKPLNVIICLKHDISEVTYLCQICAIFIVQQIETIQIDKNK